MNGQQVKTAAAKWGPWVPAIVTMAIVLTAWLGLPSPADYRALEGRLAKLENDQPNLIALLENDMKHLATKEDVADLKEAIALIQKDSEWIKRWIERREN